MAAKDEIIIKFFIFLFKKNITGINVAKIKFASFVPYNQKIKLIIQ